MVRPIFFSELFMRLNNILELACFKENEANYRVTMSKVLKCSIPLKTEVRIGNWESYVKEIERNIAEKAIRESLITEIIKERNSKLTTTYLHLLPAELSREILKFDLDSEVAKFIKILGHFGVYLAKYMAENFQDKEYKNLTKNEKLSLLKYIIDPVEQWLRQNLYRVLPKILKLKNFESLINSEVAYQDLLNELCQMIPDMDCYNFSLSMATPIALNFIKKLIDADPKIKKAAERDLSVASLRGDIEQVIMFLNFGIDINCIGIYHATPLYLAEKLQMVQLLVSRGADINKKEEVNKRTVLTKFRQMREDLIKAKNNPEQQVENHYTWCNVTIYFGKNFKNIDADIAQKEEIINYLISNGATE